MQSLSKEDEHEVETDLLEILNFDHFDLIKLLKTNWYIIYFLTMLAKAENKYEVRAESLEHERGREVLWLLDKSETK